MTATRRIDVPAPLRALIDAGLAIARRSAGGQVAIARGDGLVDPAALPRMIAGPVTAEIGAAVAAACRPLAAAEVEGALREAWGRSPARVLDDLETEPLAVRAAAQVHRATLDRAPVVVKLRRPGLDRSVRNDLVLLDTLAAPLAALFGALDPGALLREVRERALDELDLEHEADVQRRAARALRRLDGVEAPGVHTELCGPNVLVADFLEGPTLAELDAPPADPGSVARKLVAVYVGAPRALRLVLADPRPGHVVLRPGGGIGLLGLGAARAVDLSRLDAALGALAALRDDDAQASAAAIGELGVLDRATAVETHGLVRALVGDLLGGPALLDAAALAQVGERLLDALHPLLAIGAHATPEPADLWPARMIGQLGATLARLGATEDWGALALSAGRDGWG